MGYDIKGETFIVHTTHFRRIKILTAQGTDYANVSIPFFFDRMAEDYENVLDINAVAYNLENGKVIKTKVDKDLIFEDVINDK